MNFFDQWLVGITISGVLTGLLVFLYWLVQRYWPDLLSGRQKKMIWLILLVSACLVWPWPAVIYIPEPLLQRLQILRLPDINQTRITAEQVNVSVENMNEYISAISQDNNASAQQYTFDLQVDEIPRFIYQPGLDLAASFMSYWRRIYWIGLILTIIGLFLRKLKDEYLRIWGGRYQRKKNRLIVLHAKKKYQGGFPDPDAAKIWTRVLSSWRDELGYYRRGKVKYQIENPDSSGEIIKNWLGHLLPVPREVSETDWPEYWQDKSAVRAPLAMALYRLHHPDVVTSLLYCLVRVVYWFVPVWLWLHTLFQENLSEQRSQALARRLADRGRHERPILARESRSASSVILLCGVLLISFLLLNMPDQLLPRVERIDDQAVDRYGWQVHELSFNGYTEAVGSGNPLPEIHGETSIFLIEASEYGTPELYLAKTKIDQGSPSIDWWYNINSVIGGRYYFPGQLKLKDFRITGNRSLMLLFLVTDMTDLPEAGEAIWLHLDLLTGARGRIRILENPLQLVRDYCILDNGDLLVIEWQRTEDQIDSRFFTSIARPQEYRAQIRRIDRAGQLIWEIDPLAQGIDLARQTWSGFSREQGISLILADHDGGFYLSLSDNWIMQDVPSVSEDLVYRSPGSLLHFNSEGQLLWQKPLSDQRNHFIPEQALVSEQGQLFLSGQMLYQKAYFNLPSWSDDLRSLAANEHSELQNKLRRASSNYQEAHVSGHIMSFSSAGEMLWQKNLAGSISSQIKGSLLADNNLTVILKHWLPEIEQSELIVQKSLIRLDPDGSEVAWYDLPRVSEEQADDILIWLTRDQVYLSPDIYRQIIDEQVIDQPPTQETSFDFR